MKQVSPGDAIARKYPESVVFVVAPDGDGNPNVMPAGWSMFTSGDPLMIAVSIGLSRHTHTLLEEADDYVVCFPSGAQKDDVVFCGSNTGAEIDKIAESGLELAEPATISTPILEDAVACFECVPGETCKTGDHRIFAGEIVAAHVSESYDERIKNFGRSWGDGPERFRTVSELLELGDAAGVESEIRQGASR